MQTWPGWSKSTCELSCVFVPTCVHA
jgi:hypothetical protein